MMKKILPFAIVIGVVSLVACSALGSCTLEGTRILEADAGFVVSPKRADSSQQAPYNMGVWDEVDRENMRIVHQTAFVQLGDLIWRSQTLANNKKGFRASIPDIVPVASANVLGNLYCTDLESLTGSAVYNGSQGVSMWSTTTDICVYIPNLENVTPAEFPEYINEFMYYKSTNVTYEYFGDALNGEYPQDYDDGLDFGLAHLKPDVRLHVETSDAPASVWPNLRSVGVELRLNTTEASQYRFLQVSETPYEIDLPYMALGDTDYFFSVFGDDLRFDWFIDIEYSGEFNAPVNPDDDWSGYSSDTPLFLPWWEGRIDIYIDVRDSSSSVYDNDVYFGFPTSNPADVDVGNVARYFYNLGFRQGGFVGDDARSEAYSEGYANGHNDGAQEGYSQGYSIGYNAGEDAIDNAGQAVNNLFGAIVNIPVNVLNGLSGFTIWSVPLLSIIFTFLFLGIVIWIVRKFI